MKTVETGTTEALRDKVKLALDRADEKSLRRMHAILQIDEEAEEDILYTRHDDVRADVNWMKARAYRMKR